MKFHLNSQNRDTFKELKLPHRISWKQGVALKTFLFILVINALRLPSGMLNFWAEDGVVFYSDAINISFPQRLFADSGGGGYLNLSGKIIAEGVRLFPIEIAPMANFVFVNLIYAVLFILIYNRLYFFFRTKAFLLIFMGFFIFVPIASFDSVATSINLHFFLLFTCLVVLLTSETKPSLISHLIISVTCLSDPLAVLLIPVILFSAVYKRSLNSHLVTFVFSLLLQVLFVFHFFGESTRVVGQNPSIAKTFYLFIDRVVGSSFIPMWGFVDGSILIIGDTPRILYIRFFIGITVLCLVVSVLIIAKSLNNTPARKSQNFLVVMFLLTSSLYWAVAGLFFNPEPRYAILPSLCLSLVFLMSLDSIIDDRKGDIAQRYPIYVTIFLFISVFVSSFSASDIRNTNLIWSEQLAAGRVACENANLEQIEIQIPPEKNELLLLLDCDKLR